MLLLCGRNSRLQLFRLFRAFFAVVHNFLFARLRSSQTNSMLAVNPSNKCVFTATCSQEHNLALPTGFYNEHSCCYQLVFASYDLNKIKPFTAERRKGAGTNQSYAGELAAAVGVGNVREGMGNSLGRRQKTLFRYVASVRFLPKSSLVPQLRRGHHFLAVSRLESHRPRMVHLVDPKGGERGEHAQTKQRITEILNVAQTSSTVRMLKNCV